MAQAFISNINNKPQVNHIDGNKHNNHFKNLEWVTAKENTDHAIKNNLWDGSRGTKNPTNKLSNKDVLEIRGLIHEGVTVKELAEKYNVHTSTIYRIKNNTGWSCL